MAGLPWTPPERACRDALVAACLPRRRPDGLPGAGELDLRPFWRRFEQVAPPALRWGLRASVWALTLSPPWLLGRLVPFPWLAPREQDALLRAVLDHRVFLLRQVGMTLKAVTCFAYFGDPGVRARVGAPP